MARRTGEPAGVIIAAGGTGGHLYPALALGAELRSRGHAVAFTGADRLERRMVPEAGFELHSLPVRGLERSISLKAVLSGVALARSVVRARGVLRTVGPGVVVGFGGYTSPPPVFAARWRRRRIPVVLHEQNAHLVLAHRMCLRWADVLALSLPVDAVPQRPGLEVHITGNPLRPVIAELASASGDERARHRQAARERLGLDAGSTVILVTGGSQGAAALNDAAPRALGQLPGGRVQVLHLCGPAHEQQATQAWAGSAVPAAVRPYLEDMEDAYAAADLVIGRAGASTLAELLAVGLPAILVPLPRSVGPSQEINAATVAAAGAAISLRQTEPDLPGRLRDAAVSLVAGPDRRAAMAAAARGLGRPDATARLADIVEARLARA